MASDLSCKMCSNVPKKNAITKLSALSKTFVYMIAQMGNCKFTKTELDQYVICTKCLDFLKNMENSSSVPKTNKISEFGKKRVYKLTEKRRVPAAEAIEIVLAEERAKELLIEAGIKIADDNGGLIAPKPALQLLDPAMGRPKLSGSQRKKVTILINGGMEPASARQLVVAAAIAKRSQMEADASQMANVQGPNQQMESVGSVGRKRPRRRNAKGSFSQETFAQQNNTPHAGINQNSRQNVNQNANLNANQRAPVQRVAPVKVIPEKTGPKVSNQKDSAPKKITTSLGILVPQTRRQNNSGSGRGSISDKRVGAIIAPRHNERPAPYRTNRQQNQSQQPNQSQRQNQSQQQNESQQRNQSQQQNIFNQQQQQKQNVSFEVGIVPINYPNVVLDNLKLDALKDAITNEILKIPQGGPLIRFLGTSSQDGWLKIICADELSYNWLAMLVSRWERAGVRLVEGKSMPKPAILSFYLQGDFRSPDEILNIIEKQNNSLNANQWRVLNRESDGNGQRITVCVDEQCFQALRSRDFMVFLGLGVVELKPRRSASDNDFSSSSQNFGRNDDLSFLNNSSGNNMQGGRGGIGMGNDTYQSNNSGRGNGNGGGGNNYQNVGQGYQRGGFQSQRAW